MSIHLILLIIALVCFALVALNVTIRQVSLLGLGLFCLTLAFMI